MMTDIEDALESARARRDKMERELKKCPDFQLYFLTSSLDDRTRMEQLLDQNPRFRQWRLLGHPSPGPSMKRTYVSNRQSASVP